MNAFPTTDAFCAELDAYAGTDVESLVALAFRIARLVPWNTTGSIAIDDDARDFWLSVEATGTFTDVYFQTADRLITITLHQNDDAFEEVIGFGIGRKARKLTKTDKTIVRRYGFHDNHPTLPRERTEAWNRMSFSDSRVMLINTP